MARAVPTTTLMSVSTPQQFRTTILLTIGLKNSEIAEFLSTTELVVKNIMRAIYDRAGCWNRGTESSWLSGSFLNPRAACMTRLDLGTKWQT